MYVITKVDLCFFVVPMIGITKHSVVICFMWAILNVTYIYARHEAAEMLASAEAAEAAFVQAHQ